MTKLHAVAGRRAFARGLGIAAAGALGAPAVLGQTKSPYAGTTINVAAWQSLYFEYLRKYIPEFEERSGIKVNFNAQAFPVYNQRTDLELATRGSALDVVVVTFIYSGRWIGAGWLSDLAEFTGNANATPSDWNPADFLDGAQWAMRDAKGATYGYCWEAGATIMSLARYDLVEKAGLGVPRTFDELWQVCEATHGKDGVAAFTNDRTHHFNWIAFLMGMGGKVFKDPPENVTPTLNTPEAAKAAAFYADLTTRFGPEGVLSWSDDQAMRSQLAGRANIRINNIAWMTPLTKSPESTVRDTVRLALMPVGPAGNFPGANSHGLGIPVGSRKKEAGWEFIKWALSREILARMVREHGHPGICRRSVIDSPEYRQALTLNGQDVAKLYLEVLETAGRGGYMKYRTVPVFPQVGDKINKAIERIATKQQDAPAAMKQAQEESIQDLQKAGVKIDL